MLPFYVKITVEKLFFRGPKFQRPPPHFFLKILKRYNSKNIRNLYILSIFKSNAIPYLKLKNVLTINFNKLKKIFLT